MCLAIPGKLTEVRDFNMATVDLMGVKRDISIRLTPRAKVGDWVLVHAGYSIQEETEEGARLTLELLEQLPELMDEAFARELEANKQQDA